MNVWDVGFCDDMWRGMGICYDITKKPSALPLISQLWQVNLSSMLQMLAEAPCLLHF